MNGNGQRFFAGAQNDSCWGFASRRVNALRALLSLVIAIGVATFAISLARATDSDVASPVVSYHYLDTFAEPGTTIISPVVSYQYFDWPGDENLTFQSSPNVSYYFNGAPQILTQPLAQVLRTGQTATFSVSADGSPSLSYQWRLNGVNLTGGTGPTIAIDDLQPSDSGSYSVVVQNAHGTAVSTDAKLIVYLPPPNPLPTLPSMTTAGSTPPVALTTPPPPPGTLKVFTASGQLVDPAGAIDQNKKTIVMTHGWLSSPSEWPTAMRQVLKDQGHDANANILVWDWSTNASELRLWKAAGYTPKEGEALAQALMNPSALGPNYNQPIHFLGHSLGTLVNCRAADYLHGDGINLPAKSPGSYLPSNTHITLFDEAELAVPVNGARVALDVLLGKSSLTNGQGSSSPAKVIPERAKFIDNYVSEVGLLHSRAANVLLWRRIAVPGINDFIGAGLHGYSYDWYRRSIVPPAASALGLNGKRMGFFWSFGAGNDPRNQRAGWGDLLFAEPRPECFDSGGDRTGRRCRATHQSASSERLCWIAGLSVRGLSDLPSLQGSERGRECDRRGLSRWDSIRWEYGGKFCGNLHRADRAAGLFGSRWIDARILHPTGAECSDYLSGRLEFTVHHPAGCAAATATPITDARGNDCERRACRSDERGLHNHSDPCADGGGRRVL